MAQEVTQVTVTFNTQWGHLDFDSPSDIQIGKLLVNNGFIYSECPPPCLSTAEGRDISLNTSVGLVAKEVINIHSLGARDRDCKYIILVWVIKCGVYRVSVL
jgi:hypothetical protein